MKSCNHANIASGILSSGWRGAKKGIKVTIDLSKVVIPVFFIVTFLKHSGGLDYLDLFFGPVTSLVGLPGEVGPALIIGYMLNLYGAIGILAGLDLTIKQVTIVSMMLLIAHSLVMETAITGKLGVSILFMLAFRIGVSFIVGFAMNILI